MRIGRIFGVELYLNVFFLAILGLFFIAGVMAKGLIAFAVVLVHEMAHVYVARRLNVPVGEVELLPFGGVTRMGQDLVLDPFKEVMVASAGPLSNLCMVALGFALKNYNIWDEQLGSFFLQCNLLIASFNLLPALPLDGGRVYRAYLALRVGIREATRRAAGFGQFWAVSTIIFSLFGIAFHFSGLDILFTGLFLFYAATKEKRMAAYLFMRHLIKKKEELTSLGMLPAELVVAVESLTLGEIVRPFLPRRFHLVMVVNEQWQPKGVINEAQIIDGLLEHGADWPVGSLLLQPL